ncbi:MAG: tRNA (adenosine(37)-N6)-threonylcarbamoyltransferase complex ATPase subunit type 1 TsaE [Micrococcales bacterium]|nr:tRNA (adenosine(37)-N6)-threonylcarbamoyltransferase complex ATPase subunit type 1 TsaE [Micrococcales bacterium]
MEVGLPTAAATRAWGRLLAGLLEPGDLVILSGELGTGKTTLVQGLAGGLNVAGQVASPTFIMARQHRPLGDGPGLVHVDAYRLGSLDELDALDLDTSLEAAVTVVEWGQGWVEDLSSDRLEVHLTRQRGWSSPGPLDELANEPRRAQVRAVGQRWAGIALPGSPRWA